MDERTGNMPSANNNGTTTTASLRDMSKRRGLAALQITAVPCRIKQRRYPFLRAGSGLARP